MEHTTPDTATDALLAEVAALLAEGATMNARIEALLRTGSPSARMADLALQLELGRQELDQIEQYQLDIEAAVAAMEVA